MKTSVARKLLIVGFCVVVCVGAVMILARRGHADTPGETSHVPYAAVAVAKTGTISNTFSIAGEFLPYQEVELHAKVAGYIRKINVDIGDRVRAGEVLATLEIPELNAEVVGAQAGVRHSEEEITRSKNEVKRAEADHAALHAGAERLQQASEQRPGLIAAQELEDAQARDRASEAQVESAKSALSASEQELDVMKAQHQQYSAMSDYSRITAPFDGVVTWRYADTGALVQAGTSASTGLPVVKVAEVDVLRLRIPVPESVAVRVKDGDVADVRVAATGEHFQGKVVRSTDSLDRSTRSEQVEIDVPNKTYKLTAGMYADVVLHTQDVPNAVLIPVQAVHKSGSAVSVLALDAENRVQPRTIELGIEGPDRVQVVSGLNAGDRVIVGNAGSFQAGEKIEPRVSDFAKQTGAND